jgi:hypothetical protein
VNTVNETSGSIKGGEFLHLLHAVCYLNKGCTGTDKEVTDKIILPWVMCHHFAPIRPLLSFPVSTPCCTSKTPFNNSFHTTLTMFTLKVCAECSHWYMQHIL